MRNALGDCSSGVMSRNTTPGVGKSGTGRISVLMVNSSKIIGVPSGVHVSARQGAQADGIKDAYFLAFGFQQAVCLAAGENPGNGFHCQPQVVADFVTRHGQTAVICGKPSSTETGREIDQESGNALVGGF